MTAGSSILRPVGSPDTKAGQEFRRFASCAFLLFFLFFSIVSLHAWSPGTAFPDAADNFSVNKSDRTDVLAFYNTVYTASENFAAKMNWNGDIPNGIAGSTSFAFKEDVRRRINFYRALAGVPSSVSFNTSWNAKCQEAALMFSANENVSHEPPTNWYFYTANAAEAANNSNISLGLYGSDVIDAYMEESASYNYPVGHRRWLLYPRTATMATGDVPSSNGFYSANALWVIDTSLLSPPPEFIMWPNNGYSPQTLIPARWSLTYPNADFSSATVTMTRNGNPIGTTIISKSDNGYGDNTIVWEPANMDIDGSDDVVFSVTVSNIQGSGVPSIHSYSVTSFNPNILGQTLTITGSDTPSVAGEKYDFNPIVQSDAYRLRVSKGSTTQWWEGAETTTNIIDLTTANHSLTQSSVKRTGSKAFHLCFPSVYPEDGVQGFEINREFIPTITSTLVFYDHMRFFWKSNYVSAEVSTDDGNSWTEIWRRQGKIMGSSNDWDQGFNLRQVSLSSYAGTPIRIRFMIYSSDGYKYGVDDTTYGVFLDDITVTNSTELINTTTTILPANASSFWLNANTSGAPLVLNSDYFLRLSPNVGTRWFESSQVKIVQTRAATTMENWRTLHFSTAEIESGLAETEADPDHDGLSNLLEYALATDPTTAESSPTILSQIVSGNLSVTFSYDASRTDITYTIQASDTLSDDSWTEIAYSIGGAPFVPISSLASVSDLGGSGSRSVTVTDTAPPPITGKRFLRLQVKLH